MLSRLSIVIPTLNAGGSLAACLSALVPGAVEGLVVQVVIADGGSSDNTARIAEQAGADLVSCERGRGVQLAAGARKARGDWLLFLHADTVLEPGWIGEAERFMREVDGGEGAAWFRFALDDRRVMARVLEWLVRLRCALFTLPYGDQGLLVSSRLYQRIGGHGDMALMEDVDLVRRLKRELAHGRLRGLNATARTGAGRYKNGYLRRMMRNFLCLSLYFAGVSPARIKRIYG